MIIFGTDMSSFVHIDDNKGERSTQGLYDT